MPHKSISFLCMTADTLILMRGMGRMPLPCVGVEGQKHEHEHGKQER